MDLEQRRQLAERVKSARKEHGWSQARLAAEAGVSENTVLALEKGERVTQPAKLRAIEDALDIATPADGLLELDGVPEDVRIFLTVASKRLSVLEPPDRARILADVYPRLLI